MRFHIPPEYQGQIVERAYALFDGCVYRRTTDRSDKSVTYEVTYASDDDQGDYWNGAPAISRDDWDDITCAELPEKDDDAK